jgi:hypothetical protein
MLKTGQIYRPGLSNNSVTFLASKVTEFVKYVRKNIIEQKKI